LSNRHPARLILKILLVLSLLGISACAYARHTISFTSKPPPKTKPFVVYASDYAYNLGYVDLDVYNMTSPQPMTREPLTAVLDLFWEFSAQGLNSTLAVGLRVPRDAEMQDATEVMSFKNGTQEYRDIRDIFNRSYVEEESATYFDATTSRLSKDGKLLYPCVVFSTRLRWKEFLYQESYSRYSLIVPFSVFGENYFREMKPFYLGEANSSILTVGVPASSSVVQTNPPAEQFASVDGELAYIWNISRVAKPWLVQVVAVAVDMEMNALANYEQEINYWTALGFGIGVPLVLTSLVELVKLRGAREKPDDHGKRVIAKRGYGTQSKRAGFGVSVL
jgi:hypothetical protein